MFPGLRIEAPPLSTVQGKCIYIFLKQRTRKLNFRSYVLNLVKINVSFFRSKVEFRYLENEGQGQGLEEQGLALID